MNEIELEGLAADRGARRAVRIIERRHRAVLEPERGFPFYGAALAAVPQPWVLNGDLEEVEFWRSGMLAGSAPVMP